MKTKQWKKVPGKCGPRDLGKVDPVLDRYLPAATPTRSATRMDLDTEESEENFSLLLQLDDAVSGRRRRFSVKKVASSAKKTVKKTAATTVKAVKKTAANVETLQTDVSKVAGSVLTGGTDAMVKQVFKLITDKVPSEYKSVCNQMLPLLLAGKFMEALQKGAMLIAGVFIQKLDLIQQPLARRLMPEILAGRWEVGPFLPDFTPIQTPILTTCNPNSLPI